MRFIVVRVSEQTKIKVIKTYLLRPTDSTRTSQTTFATFSAVLEPKVAGVVQNITDLCNEITYMYSPEPGNRAELTK